jgi:hypothetical protein
MATVYLIMNESFPKGANFPLSEIVSPARWSYQDAVDDLADIAREAGVELDDESSVYLPPKGDHLETDEYYIIPLEVEDRG